MAGLCLHIGLPKTGSSAIQGFLAANAAGLAEQGVHYSLARDAIADSAGVPNGNARALLKYLDPRRRKPGWDPEAFERSGFRELYMPEPDRPSLISSELLSNVEWGRLYRLRDDVLAGVPVRIVAVVRNLYDHALSTWNQLVKWHAYAGSFEAFALNEYSNPQLKSLSGYARCFGWKRIAIVNYDEAKGDILRPFLQAVGVEAPSHWSAPRVNRSLSAPELMLQLALNRVHHDGGLSRQAARLLVFARPRAASARLSRPDIAAQLGERFRPRLERLSAEAGRDLTWMADLN